MSCAPLVPCLDPDTPISGRVSLRSFADPESGEPPCCPTGKVAIALLPARSQVFGKSGNLKLLAGRDKTLLSKGP